MNTIATDVLPVRTRKKQKSLLEIFNLKGQIDSYKFNKMWADRNIDNGELIIDSLELDPIIMDQYMFLEEDKRVIEKLGRIGFKELNKYPKSEQFSEFSYVLYNDKYNIAISVYKPTIKQKLLQAEEIAKDTKFEFEHKLEVFLSAVKILNK